MHSHRYFPTTPGSYRAFCRLHGASEAARLQHPAVQSHGRHRPGGKIEIVEWTVSCLIMVILAVLIWNARHSLDPYKPIQSDVKPVRVQVVALNWKWLFIYLDWGAATVNQMRISVGTPIKFSLTPE